MRDTPLISVIIPVYNRAAYLLRCIKSVRAQGYKNHEIIVIDDCSTENLDEAASYCDKYIRNDINLGPSCSKNLGALSGSGEILLFLDSDVELLPDTLKNLPEIFKSGPGIGAIGGEGPPDGSGQNIKFIRLIRYSAFGRKIVKKCCLPEKGQKPEIHDTDIIASAFLAITKDLFYLAGGFDPYFYYIGEDRDLCFNLKKRGYRLVVSSDTGAIHFTTRTDNKFKAISYMRWSIYYLSKCLEATVKNKGISGGILWMIGNCQVVLNPIYFFILIKQLIRHKQFSARENINYLAADKLLEYRRIRIKNYLKERLPFRVSFPLPAPGNIVLFVTSKCNALCRHCFIKGIPKPENDMSAKEIVGIFAPLKSSTHLILTGGEPFLRNDLEEIVRGLMGLKPVRSIYIASNGSSPAEIESLCRNVCGSYKKPLYLQISLDGLEKTHDLIRKIPLGFKKAIETCEKLNCLKKRYPNLSFLVNISIMRSNLPDIKELVDYLEYKKYPSKLTIVRGNSFSTFHLPSALLNAGYDTGQDEAPSTEKIQKALKEIKSGHPSYFNAFQKAKLKITLDTLDSKMRQMPCYAGYDDAVIYSDGSIGICEQAIPFGRLQDWDWDLLKAWNSPEAMEHRVKLLSCACIHGCNITTSIKKRKPWLLLGNR